MRCVLLLIGLSAACTTWTTHEMDEETWPVVIEALRAADGQAIVVAGERGYLVQPDALRDELTAFNTALADAIEAQGPPTKDDWRAPQATERKNVVAFPHVTRWLQMGTFAVKSFRTETGTRYRAEVQTRENHFAEARARGTPEIDGAWQRLANAARREAGATNYNVLIGPSEEFLREVGVDFRGLGVH